MDPRRTPSPLSRVPLFDEARERGDGALPRVIFGDNLPLLQALPSEAVPLIYIDPPFNTGRTQARPRLRTERDDDGDRTGFHGARYRTTRFGGAGTGRSRRASAGPSTWPPIRPPAEAASRYSILPFEPQGGVNNHVARFATGIVRTQGEVTSCIGTHELPCLERSCWLL